MIRVYRFRVYVVEGEGSKMKTVLVASAPTANSANVKMRAHQKANGVANKRIGIHDAKLKRWHDMPLILR